jgi:hypothetical protein
LNPIELFRRYLKEQACANKLQDNLDKAAKTVVKLMTAQNWQSSEPEFHVSMDLTDYADNI